MALDALKDPKVKIEVAAAYSTEAPVSSMQYIRRYLTEETSEALWLSY